MLSDAKYSIILPVRNGGEYVKECINSILAQDYPGFQLHVLDNCSNDGTTEWIRSVMDERIRIYPSSSPLSMDENWGRIVNIPRNLFMTIIGHDDVLDRDYLSVMDDLIQRYPEASLYQTHFRLINSKGTLVRECKEMAEIQRVDEFLQSILTQTLDSMGTGYMMRTADYDEVGGIQAYPNLLFADHELWLRITAISFKATASRESFSFRLHDSISKKSSTAKYIQAFFRFLEFLKVLEDREKTTDAIIKRYVPEYIRYHNRSLAHRLLKTPENQREGMTVSSFIDKCQSYAHELAPQYDFLPDRQLSIWLAKKIDTNIFLRRIYLLFRRVYRRPIYP